MFALWMFGNVLENVWGPKRFLIYYLITGFGAAILYMGVNYIELQVLKSELLAAGYTSADLRLFVNSGQYQILPGTSESTLVSYLRMYYIPVVGASGAVFGILLGFGMLFPNSLIYLFFAIPIKAKYFVMIYGALELYLGLSRTGSNIAHFAHLGGMIFGFLLIRYWKSKGKMY
jgi:membrane associated rhomboid family serine protease